MEINVSNESNEYSMSSYDSLVKKSFLTFFNFVKEIKNFLVIVLPRKAYFEVLSSDHAHLLIALLTQNS